MGLIGRHDYPLRLRVAVSIQVSMLRVNDLIRAKQLQQQFNPCLSEGNGKPYLWR